MCIVGCLSASPASAHRMLGSFRLLGQTQMSQEAKYPVLGESHPGWSRIKETVWVLEK